MSARYVNYVTSPYIFRELGFSSTSLGMSDFKELPLATGTPPSRDESWGKLAANDVGGAACSTGGGGVFVAEATGGSKPAALS